MYTYVHVPVRIHLFPVYLSIYLPIYPFIYLSYLSIHLSVNLSVYAPIHLPIYLSVSTYMSTDPSTYPPSYLSDVGSLHIFWKRTQVPVSVMSCPFTYPTFWFFGWSCCGKNLTRKSSAHCSHLGPDHPSEQGRGKRDALYHIIPGTRYCKSRMRS